MLRIKKRLTITIDEPRESEEDIQLMEINKEFSAYQLKNEDSPHPSFEEDRKKIQELNNPYINQLLNYMEGEHPCTDYSYSWINKLYNISLLTKSVFVSPKTMDKILSAKDFEFEFRILKLITEDQKHKENQISLSKSLRRNNRYTNMLPYKHNVALIGNIENESSSNDSTSTTTTITATSHVNKNFISHDDNYINASYIDGPLIEDNKIFIATQGPLANTLGKFWKLCYSQNIKLILMLCSLQEEGRIKCEQYWPYKIGTARKIEEEDLEIFLEKEEWVINDCLILREIIIRIHGKEKHVTHLQMLNWPDHCQPNEDTGYSAIELLLNIIADFRHRDPDCPVLAHCSAGTGRTGTLIALYFILKCLVIFKWSLEYFSPQVKLRPFMSVFNIVRKLREQRIGMVSSWQQYKYIYQFVFEWIKRYFDGIWAFDDVKTFM